MLSLIDALRCYVSARQTTRISDRRVLERLQQDKLRVYRQKVLKQTPFYQNSWNVPLENLPIVDKAQYLDEFAAFNTKGIGYDEALDVVDRCTRTGNPSAQIGDVTVGCSTGTTGKRGVFLVTHRERMRWLGAILAKSLPSGLFAFNRIALLLAANSKLYQSSTELPNLKFRFFDLHEPIDRHIEGLNAFSPTILVGTVQSLRLLAEFKQSGKLIASPQRILSGGEVLEDSDAEFIERCFGQSPGQIYQCTEGFFGTTCEHGTIHLNEDFQIFEKEWIDRDSGRFVPIITDLSRDTQALVRYRMNDILVEAEKPCPCGSALTAVSKIEGRCDDTFLVPSACEGRIVPIMPEVLRRAVSRAGKSISEYKLQQVSSLELRLAVPRLASAEDVDAAKKSLFECFSSFNCLLPEIRTTEGVEVATSRKLRRVERTFAIGTRIGS